MNDISFSSCEKLASSTFASRLFRQIVADGNTGLHVKYNKLSTCKKFLVGG